MLNRFSLIFSVLILGACGRTFPSGPPENRPQPAEDQPLDLRRETITSLQPLALMPSTSVRHYVTTSTTALQLQFDAEVSHATVKTTLEFHLAIFRMDSLQTRLAGTLTQLSVEAGVFPQPADSALFLPLRFTGYAEGGGLLLDSLANAPIGSVIDCRIPGLNVMASIQRNIIIPPLVLSTGVTWTDSSTVPVCSGSIPLSLTAVRSYTVAGQTIRNSVPVILVERTDRVTASGNGAQGQHRISIISQGSGSARIYLNRTSGLLHESESTQTTELVIGSSGRSQRFKQSVAERVQLRL